MDELAAVKEMRYEYKTPNSRTDTGLNFDDVRPRDKIFVDRSHKLVRADALIEVRDHWGGNTEKFTLQSAE